MTEGRTCDVSADLRGHRAAVSARLIESTHLRAGPGSITWKVNREVVVVAGWGRAILLQLAHPAVAAGVHGHSSFRGSLRSSLRRLHSTVRAMLSISFGDSEQMITAAAGINMIHSRVRGRAAMGRARRTPHATPRFSGGCTRRCSSRCRSPTSGSLVR